MTKKRWTVEDKAKIVMESLTTSTSTVDICKKYGLSYPDVAKVNHGRDQRPRVMAYAMNGTNLVAIPQLLDILSYHFQLHQLLL